MTDPRDTPVNDRVVARWWAAEFPDRKAVDPEPAHVAAPLLDLSFSPGGPRTRQMVYGQPFEVLERRDGFAFGIANVIDYVGWVASDGLAPDTARGEAFSWVGVRQTHVYPEPDLKHPESMALSHMALLVAGEEDGRFTRTELGWVPSMHLTDQPEEDPVAVAELFLGTPYLWGGNSAFGIDCSGLVQAAALACGIACPGDSDQQARAFAGLPLDAPPRRGDLYFWKGHVALAMDGDRFIHANAHSMNVAIEGISGTIARIEAAGEGPVTARGHLGP